MTRPIGSPHIIFYRHLGGYDIGDIVAGRTKCTYEVALREKTRKVCPELWLKTNSGSVKVEYNEVIYRHFLPVYLYCTCTFYTWLRGYLWTV